MKAQKEKAYGKSLDLSKAFISSVLYIFSWNGLYQNAVLHIDELQDFSVQIFGHCRRILVENKELVFNAQTIILVVLNGQADVEGDYIGSIPNSV